MPPAMPENNQHAISALHQGLIDQLKRNGHIQTASVEAALRAVPRHLFLPGMAPEEVYRDQAIGTKSIKGQPVSSSSQPTIMAIMLEQLQLQPGQRVLEIGAGTGYNAALMAHIVGVTGQVITIDIDEDIVEGARAHLAAAGFGRVRVICADGGLGYSKAAPYDRIILTVNAGDITPAWRAQLKKDGRLLLPLSLRGQQASIAFTPVEDYLESLSIRACGFVELRGTFAETQTTVQLSSEPGQLVLRLGEARSVNAQTVSELLSGRYQDLPLSIQISPHMIFFGLGFWLALHEALFCILSARGPFVEQGIVPRLFSFPGKIPTISTGGLLSDGALSVLMCDPDATFSHPLTSGVLDITPFNLYVRSFGDAETLTQQLKNQVQAWDEAGRPGEQQLHIKSYPHTRKEAIIEEAGTVIAKAWSYFVCTW